MCHLQPNLEGVHIGQAARIAPGINLRERCCTCIRDPGAVCCGKIQNRQITMLVTHCGPERKLNVNREWDCDGHSSDGHEFLLVEINFIEGPPKTCHYKRDH